MEKENKKQIKKLTVIGAISIAVVAVCIYFTITGSILSSVVGVVFAVVGCVALEEADVIEKRFKNEEVGDVY